MAKLNAIKVVMRIMGSKQKFAAHALASAQQKLQIQHEQLQLLQANKKNFVQEFPESSDNAASEKAAQEYELKLAQIDRDIEQTKTSIARCVDICEQRRREWVRCGNKIKTVKNLQYRQILQEITIEEENN